VSGGGSPADLLAGKILDRLGAGDDIFAAETLKHAAIDLAIVLENLDSPSRLPTEDQDVSALTAPAEEPAEVMLAVLLPVIEYGGPASHAAIPRALRHLARKAGLLTDSSRSGVTGTLVLGRIVWAIAACSLSCERLDGLAAAWRATTDPRHEEDVPTPLLADSSLRHADMYGRSADKAYEDYRSWLAERELLAQRSPLLLAELDLVFPEADVLLALLTATTRGSVYAHGLTAQTVMRFRGRAAQAHHRAQLAALFGVSDANLEDVLASAYQRLETEPRHWEQPPEVLFPSP
jgi:hypothetical protein